MKKNKDIKPIEIIPSVSSIDNLDINEVFHDELEINYFTNLDPKKYNSIPYKEK